MAGVAAVCFDLDGTLLEYNRTTEEVLAESFATCDFEPFFDVQDYYRVFDDHVDAGDSIAEIRTACFERIALDCGRDPQVGRTVADAYAAERDQSAVTLYPGVEDMLASLSREYPLGLITNGPRRSQAKKLAATDIKDWFDVLVYAGDEVAAKPDPAPFRRALTELAVTPDEAVHVGNSLESDVTGAAGIGMTSVWITDGEDPTDVQPDYQVDATTDVLDLGLFG